MQHGSTTMVVTPERISSKKAPSRKRVFQFALTTDRNFPQQRAKLALQIQSFRYE
jgi:hypothetical protein